MSSATTTTSTDAVTEDSVTEYDPADGCITLPRPVTGAQLCGWFYELLTSDQRDWHFESDVTQPEARCNRHEHTGARRLRFRDTTGVTIEAVIAGRKGCDHILQGGTRHYHIRPIVNNELSRASTWQLYERLTQLM